MEQFKKIGINCNIKANNIEIGKNVIIGDNVNIVCDTFKLGDNTILGSNININCKSFISDEWLFMWDGVEVGRGGSYGPNSNVKIGKHVGIFEKTMINPSDSVTIGDDVGIGGEVMIWTHGAWLDVMQGFPSDFGPVKGKIILTQEDNNTTFNLTNKTITGFENKVSEDLRDYLRRRGIKIFTKNQFKSI